MIKTLIAIGSIVGALTLTFVYVVPTYDAVQAIQKEAEQYGEALSRAREVDELKRGLIAKYNLFSPQNIERLKKFLPDHVDNVHLVLDIDGIAARHGLRIGNVVARKEGEKKGAKSGNDDSIGIDAAVVEGQRYKSLILEFGVTATYADFVSFVRDLEQSLRVVDVVSLSMEPVQTASPLSTPAELRGLSNSSTPAPQINPTYRFTIAIRTYWLP